MIQDFNDLVGASQEKKAVVDIEKEMPSSIEQLKKQMKEAAEALNFEEAAKIRDRLRKLEQLAVQDF